MVDSAANFGFLFTSLEVCKAVSNGGALEAISIASTLSEEVRRSLKSLGMAVFKKEPVVQDANSVKMALIGSSSTSASFGKAKITISTKEGVKLISLSGTTQEMNGRYSQILSDYFGGFNEN